MNQNKSKKLIVLAAIGAGLLTIGLLVGLILLINSIINRQPSSTLNDDDYEAISEFIQFSDAQTESYFYQSPLYDFGVTINTKIYNFTETQNGLNVNSKDYKKQVYITISENTDNSDLSDVITEFESENQYLTNFLIANREDINISGLPAKKIIYTYNSFSGSKVTVVTALVVNEKYKYEIQQINYDEAEPDLTLFVACVANFRIIDSSKVNNVAKYESSLWGYSYSYDAKYWTLNYNDYSSALNQRIYETNTDNTIKIDIYSTELLRSNLAGSESSYLRDKFEEEVGEISASTSYDYSVTNTGDIEIAGRRGKYVEYTRNDSPDYLAKHYKEIYFIHYNTLTKITINYGSEYMLSLFNPILATFAVEEPTRGVVKGVSSTTGTDERIAMLTKPAVVQIFIQRCGNLNLPYASSLPNTSGKEYEICASASGSGFFINSKGYVATNGHVATFTQKDFTSGAWNENIFINLFKDLVLPELAEANPSVYSSMTNQQIYTYLKNNPRVFSDLAAMNQSFITKAYSYMTLKDTIFVQKNVNAFELDYENMSLKNPQEAYEAELIDVDFDPEMVDEEGKETSSDIAILKIEDGDYPVLTLGSNEFTISGKEVMAVGFPGAADIGLMDEELESQETFTKGVVSRIVTTTGDRTLVQIDASINHGNSGGPLIGTDDGKVLGLVTYGSDDSGASDFNFARDVADLKTLMGENDVTNTAGNTQQKLSEGIAYFFDGYYSKAVASLEEAKDSYPDIEGLDKIIALAKDKIAQGLDKKEEEKSNDPFAFIGNMTDTEKILFIVVACLICVVLMLFFGMVVVFRRTRKNKQNPPTESSSGLNTPIPPVAIPSAAEGMQYANQPIAPYQYQEPVMAPQQQPVDGQPI